MNLAGECGYVIEPNLKGSSDETFEGGDEAGVDERGNSFFGLSLDVANLLGAGVENLNGVGIVGTDGLVDEADDLIASHGVAIVATDAYNEAAQVAAAEEIILLRGSRGRRKRKRGLRRCCYCCLS